ncbi:hypothetical protein QQ045_003824 [Rhodiola kirilowii]
MEIPFETGTGNPSIIVDAPKESPHSPVQADPGLRQLICTFSVNEQDRILREYLLMGPHQPKKLEIEHFAFLASFLKKSHQGILCSLSKGVAIGVECWLGRMEYVDDIDSETVIDHFESIGDRRAQFR